MPYIAKYLRSKEDKQNPKISHLKSNYGCLTTIIIIILLILGRIVYVSLNSETYSAKFPLTKIEKSFEWLTVQYSPNELISKIVNTDVFNGFNPNMTIDEFEEILGEPFESTIEEKFIEHNFYRTNFGEIEVVDGFYQYDEGDVLVKYINLKPLNVSIDEILDDYLTDIVKSNGDIEKISICRKDSNKGIRIYLKLNKIDSITWDSF